MDLAMLRGEAVAGPPMLSVEDGSLQHALAGDVRKLLEQDVLPRFLERQRWFSGKGAAIQATRLVPIGEIGPAHALVLLEVQSTDGAQCYFLPLSALWDDGNELHRPPSRQGMLAGLRSGAREGVLLDSVHDERFLRSFLTETRQGGRTRSEFGEIRFSPTAAGRMLNVSLPIRPVGVEQSNVSLIVGDAAMLKIYRQVRSGEQPEIEMARFLTEVANFKGAPTYLGSVEYQPDSGEVLALAALFSFVRNQGDAWSVVLDSLAGHLGNATEVETGGGSSPEDRSLDLAAVLARRTAEMHVALATPTDDPSFAAEPVEVQDVERWVDETSAGGERAFAEVRRLKSGLDNEQTSLARTFLAAEREIMHRLSAQRNLLPAGQKTRIHGDYHLGQVLVDHGDVIIVDFEGEPLRGLEERRQKTSPLRDVAGMLRSFDYAAFAALARLDAGDDGEGPSLRARAFAWRQAATQRFLAGYWSHVAGSGLFSDDLEHRRSLLEIFLLQKAFYEIAYEAAHRPGWVAIPLRGALDLAFPNR